MPMIEGAGAELHYELRGQGPPVLLVHELASDAAGFGPLVAALGDRFTTIVYDRRGYGTSGAPEPYTATTVNEQAQDAAALLAGLDLGQAPAAAAAPARAIAVGVGFGALIVLDLLVRHPTLVASAVVVDPPLLAFVPAATEILSADRARLEQAVRDGGPQGAVEVWLDGRVEGPALDRARDAHRGFLADFAGLASWPVTRRELRAITQRLVVLTRPATPPHILAAADALAGLAPAAERRRDGDLAGAVSALL